jgi:hypothetical protein
MPRSPSAAARALSRAPAVVPVRGCAQRSCPTRVRRSGTALAVRDMHHVRRWPHSVRERCCSRCRGACLPAAVVRPRAAGGGGSGESAADSLRRAGGRRFAHACGETCLRPDHRRAARRDGGVGVAGGHRVEGALPAAHNEENVVHQYDALIRSWRHRRHRSNCRHARSTPRLPTD